MKQHIGKLIRSKLREKRITDPQVARFLNLSVSAVEKIYPQDDIYVSRLIKLSQLLKEDLFELYYKQEPLRSLRKTEIDRLKSELENLNNDLLRKNDHIKNVEHMNDVQQKLIYTLSSEISALPENKINKQSNDHSARPENFPNSKTNKTKKKI